MSATPAQNEIPLGNEETARLRNILRIIRLEHSVKYVDLTRKINISLRDIYGVTSKRRNGTRAFLEAVEKYCDINKISIEDIDRNDEMDSILEQMEIDDDLIKEAGLFSGDYALISFIDEKRIGISWITLHACSRLTRLPTFVGWRRTDSGPSEIRGVYYHFANSLFLIGHRADTPLARFVTTAPINDQTQDRFGFISGASAVETLFQSFCYLKRLPEIDDSILYKKIAVELSIEDFEKTYPNESHFMKEKASFFFSVRKSGGA